MAAKIKQAEKGKQAGIVSDSINYPGRKGPIDTDSIAKALDTFRRYKSAKTMMEQRIVENDQWWKLDVWNAIGRTEGKEDDPEPTSAWMFNSIANKHADAMDNFPMPNFLPREQSDDETAKRLQKIVPCILEANEFEQTYSDAWWYKAIMGTVPYGVFWNSSKENGLGDIDIQQLDLLNLFWEPGIKNIQDSTNMFSINAVDRDVLLSKYPFLFGSISGGINGDIVRYVDVEEKESDENKVVVYDWYYKIHNSEGRLVVHYCKFAEGNIIYASENDERYAEAGYYDHGKYPFVFDTLFPLNSSPVGLGYVDIMKSPQLYIDKLDQIVLNNAAMTGKSRYFVSNSANVNMDEFADWSKEFVHVDGSVDPERLAPIQVQQVPAYIINHMQLKIDELKETSGNRDFSQGGTASGVTAASAIAALQEAGSKLSRDMIKTSYRAYKQINQLVLELMAQFYTEDRCFRIDGPNGEYEFETFNNSGLMPQTVQGIDGMLLTRKPIFDIKIMAQKQSPFSREAQNETAKEFFQLGVFNPQLATQAEAMLEMVEFEGSDKIKELVRNNDMKAQATNQLAGMAMQMAQSMDAMTGQPVMQAQIAQLAAAATGTQMQAAQPANVAPTKTDSAGMPVTDNTQATQARLRAGKQAEAK